MGNNTAVVLQSVTSEITEAFKMETILDLHSQRYMVFSGETGLYIMKMIINEEGNTEFHDITDNHEFELVSKSYQALW